MACVGVADVRWRRCGQSSRSRSHAGLIVEWRLKLGCDWLMAVQLWCAIRFAMQLPAAWRDVAFGVVVPFSIRNLQVVWRATVVACIAEAADRPRRRGFGSRIIETWGNQYGNSGTARAPRAATGILHHRL